MRGYNRERSTSHAVGFLCQCAPARCAPGQKIGFSRGGAGANTVRRGKPARPVQGARAQSRAGSGLCRTHLSDGGRGERPGVENAEQPFPVRAELGAEHFGNVLGGKTVGLVEDAVLAGGQR
jgi:hypothetical protein